MPGSLLPEAKRFAVLFLLFSTGERGLQGAFSDEDSEETKGVFSFFLQQSRDVFAKSVSSQAERLWIQEDEEDAWSGFLSSKRLSSRLYRRIFLPGISIAGLAIRSIEARAVHHGEHSSSLLSLLRLLFFFNLTTHVFCPERLVLN